MKINPDTYEGATVEALRAMQAKIAQALKACDDAERRHTVVKILRRTTTVLFHMNASAHVRARMIPTK